MSDRDDIKELKEDVKKLQDSVSSIEAEKKVDEKVKTIVKLRCAAAYASILGFISILSGIVTFYSDIAKEAAKAAVKVIIERFSQ